MEYLLYKYGPCLSISQLRILEEHPFKQTSGIVKKQIMFPIVCIIREAVKNVLADFAR